jgi:hypothetical protein
MVAKFGAAVAQILAWPSWQSLAWPTFFLLSQTFEDGLTFGLDMVSRQTRFLF